MAYSLAALSVSEDCCQGLKQVYNFFHKANPRDYYNSDSTHQGLILLKYQIIYSLNFVGTYFLMKLASWLRTPREKRPPALRFFWLDPHLSTRPRISPLPLPFSFLIIKLALCLVFLFLMVLIAKYVFYPLNYLEVILISPIVYFLTEAMSSAGEMLYYLTGKVVTPLHSHPLRSQSLSEFWGKRWNLMVQDWFRDLRGESKKNLGKKLLVTFLISGFFHEIMISLPYFIYTGRFVFGNMMLYFAIQGCGLWIEKSFLSSSPNWVRRAQLWMFILLPCPLFIREPFLTFFGIHS
jgi:hypothetical protein